MRGFFLKKKKKNKQIDLIEANIESGLCNKIFNSGPPLQLINGIIDTALKTMSLHLSTFSDTVFLSPYHGLLARVESRITATEDMVGDIEKMIAVGLVWGATNAIMRRGALLWDQALKSSSSSNPPHFSSLRQKIIFSLKNWLKLLSIWQYTIPFFINLSASATFFAILSDAPISLAVPITNATTFAATAVFGILLGEKTHLGRAMLGTASILLGVWFCIKS